MTSDERHNSWQALLQIASERRTDRTLSPLAPHQNFARDRKVSADRPEPLLDTPDTDLFALYAKLAAGSGKSPDHFCLAHLGQSIYTACVPCLMRSSSARERSQLMIPV